MINTDDAIEFKGKVLKIPNIPQKIEVIGNKLSDGYDYFMNILVLLKKIADIG
jgi:hypothetical protein